MSNKDTPSEIPLPVPIAFIVTSQKAVAISLLICRTLSVGRVVTSYAAGKEVRAVRIVTLAAARVIGAGEQAILISAFIGALPVGVPVVVPFIIDGRVDVVRIVRIAITIMPSTGVFVAISVAVFVAIAS